MPLCLRPGFLFVSMSGQGGHSVGLCRGTIADKYHQSNRPKATKNSAFRPKTVRNTCCFAPRNEPYGNAIRGCVKMWLKGVNRSWTTCRFAGSYRTRVARAQRKILCLSFPNYSRPIPDFRRVAQLRPTTLNSIWTRPLPTPYNSRIPILAQPIAQAINIFGKPRTTAYQLI